MAEAVHRYLASKDGLNIALGVAMSIGLLIGAALTWGHNRSTDGTVFFLGPDNSTIAIAGSDAGPTRTSRGLGTGFAQTEDGAAAAATHALLAIARADAMTTERRAAEIGADLAANEARQRIADRLVNNNRQYRTWLSDGARTVTERTDNPPQFAVYNRVVPAGFDVVRYSDERATVRVWFIEMWDHSWTDRDPQARSRVFEMEMVWEDNDWHLWEYHHLPDDAPELTTRFGDQITDTNDFVTAVDNLTSYRVTIDD